MKSSTITIIVLLVLLGCAVTYIGVTRQNTQNEQPVTPVTTSVPNMHAMHGMMVASERAFIEGMIPHHEEAITTAKEVIARGGTTAEIRVLAEGIVTAQEAEVATMKQWYESWYGVPYQGDGSYVPMMRDLKSLTGAALDRTFLEDMIGHHMGAIMMAQSVSSRIEHGEMSELTKAIVETQSAEIELTKRLLGGL